jgi:Flp pilus assembly protein TadG
MVRWFSAWLRTPLRHQPRSQRGQAIIMMAIALPVLVGFVGLVADVGLLYVVKGRLQNSVDAAALAGAQGLPGSYAETLACDYITLNPVSNMTGSQCTGKADVTLTADSITVVAHRSVPSLIIHVLPGSFLPANVGARAKVKIGSPASGCVFPFFLQLKEITTPWTLTSLTRGTMVDVGSGASAIRDAMQVGNCSKSGTVNAGGIDLKPGESAQISSGWQDRLQNVATSSCPQGDVIANYRVQVATGQYQLLSTLTPTNCPRLVILSVLPNATTADGKYTGNEKNLSLLGFAAFWIRDYCDHPTCTFSYDGGVSITKGNVWGYFVPLSVPATTYTTYNPAFGTKVVVMTE